MGKYYDLYKTLKENIQKTNGKAFSEDEFEHYIDKVEKSQNKDAKMSSADLKVHNVILNQLLTNTKANAALKDKLPKLEAAKNKHLERLRKESQMYAKANQKKSEANAIKAKQKAARKELERIRRESIKNEALAQGRTATKEELADAKLYAITPASAGKSGKIADMVNEQALGTEYERKGLNEDTNKEITAQQYENHDDAILITHENMERGIRLEGAKFEPDPRVKKDPERVALVFSGSGGPGAKYIDSIKDAYLAQGITVVQLDYREFGKSTSINEQHKEVSMPLSERSMYEDGMEMYKYVNETMGIKPENIVLHGYSLGGAIASRVALEVSKNIENQRKINGEKKDFTKGLGGVVLHSPMKSMYYAAKTQSNAFYGFGGWAFGGNYNTEEHMTELAKVDKNIPVHVVGGKVEGAENDIDWLAPQKTGLEKALEGKFNNYTKFHGQSNHEGIMNGEVVPNISQSDTGLKDFLDKGREVNRERQIQAEQNQAERGSRIS